MPLFEVKTMKSLKKFSVTPKRFNSNNNNKMTAHDV